jgi:RNA polymerase sigma-70 factor (ECF subfamily)
VRASASIGASERLAPPHGSFEQIYEAWFEQVARWVRALGTREADCSDLAQEVFIVAYRRMNDFDGENVAGWLYQIARRKVRDYRRLAWVKHLFGSATVAPFDRILRTDAGPLDQLETRKKLELLESLLATIKPDQRAAFVLFEIEGLSGQEIAELQQVPINTVWGRIHTTRRWLQAHAARREPR